MTRCRRSRCAAHLEGPDAELHAEGDRLGMDAVGAAHLDRVAELEGAPLEHRPERDQVALEDRPGPLDLQRQPGVEHVARGHPVVDVLARVADVLGHVRQEGDDVVVGRLFDLGDADHVERRLRLDLLDGFVGHVAELVPGLHGGDLDIEPGLHLGLFAPDGAHLGQGVALDHRFASTGRRPPGGGTDTVSRPILSQGGGSSARRTSRRPRGLPVSVKPEPPWSRRRCGLRSGLRASAQRSR